MPRINILLVFALLLFFCGIFAYQLIYPFVSQKNNEHKFKNTLILYYKSNIPLCIQFINGVWNDLKKKYCNNSNIEFTEIDIYNHPKYNYVFFNNIPTIYYINVQNHFINKFPDDSELSYINIKNFLIKSFSMFNN